MQKALPFVINLSCNNIYVLQDNGTVSGSLTKTIPSIQPVSSYKFSYIAILH